MSFVHTIANGDTPLDETKGLAHVRNLWGGLD
jgi:hypothetical protein